MDSLREQPLRPLTAADLAGIPDFRLGEATVSASRRTLSGPGGTADLQPRMMQVLVVLWEHAGQVMSRETLFERCWGDVYVGDDSLNRVVAALRKLGAEISDGGFEIETIPKTGYRLTVAEGREGLGRRVTRRQLAGAAAGVVALSTIGGWAVLRSRDDQRFEQLLRDGDAAFVGGKHELWLRSFEAATRMRPDDPRALGRLALAQSFFALYDAPEHRPAVAALATQTAQRALAIDRREARALMALWELQGSTLDWWDRDRRLRQIIAIDPTFDIALSELASLLMASGMSRESWDWNERLLRLTPLSEICLGRRAQKLWIFGRLGDADNVINQARAQFPTSEWIWSNRFLLYAFTDRPQAAQAMLESDPGMLRAGPERQMWRASLDALVRRSAESIGKAREVCVSAAQSSGELAGHAMMILCALGDVDSAFQIADGYLLSRGPVVRRGNRPYGPETSDALPRINSWFLFWPPCRNMRDDGRFFSLCDGIGLVEYWRRRGVQPDYMGGDRSRAVG